MHLYKRIIHTIRKRKKTFIAAALLLAAILFFIFGRKGDEIGTVEAKLGSVAQEVVVTGKTKSASDAALSFEKSGRVIAVNAKVGDRVEAGQTLVRLDASELSADRLEAQANLEAEEARLNELKRGTRQEEIAIQEAKVRNAETAVAEAKKAAVNDLKDAYTKADDGIRAKMDQFINSPLSESPQLAFSINDSTLEIEIERGRLLAEVTLNTWKASIEKFTYGTIAVLDLRNGEKNLEQIKSVLDKAAVALSSLTASPSLLQSTIDKYRSDIASARSNLSTALSNVQNAEEKLSTAEANLTIAEKELILKRNGATAEEIAAQEAKVKQARANLQGVEAQLAKLILTSPIRGVVTEQEAGLGEVVSANTRIVSIISEGNLEIEADVSEVDIGRIQTGNPVTITLDAFSGETFPGSVVYIEPGEKIIDGVVNFRVKVAFAAPDSRMKTGLTANLAIQTAKKEQVLVLPEFAIIERGGSTFVHKIENGSPKEVPITIGIRGQDGNVEILSGLAAGDTVVNPSAEP